MRRSALLVFCIFLILSFTTPVYSEATLRVAVAANFISPFNEIKNEFEKKTGIKVEGVFTSTGSLYNQIINGAPYDLFLSADEERPEALFKAGLSDKPLVYAKGAVVLWSGNKNFCNNKDWRESLVSNKLKKIAIANPLTAPYGTSALNALDKSGIAAKIKDKTVTAQTVAQSFQYASTGAVDAAFCAMSAVVSEEGKKGCYYKIEDAPPVVQSACVLKRSGNSLMAEKFAEFLLSPEAGKIKLKYGYE